MMTMYSNRKARNSRRNWTWIDTRTITLKVFKDWDDFVELTGISDDLSYRKVFDYLYGLYGNVYTKQDTIEVLGTTLRFYIENEVEKQSKQNEIWDNQIEKLMGNYEELNQYGVGRLLPHELDKNFNKYLFARQTKLQQNNILDQVQKIQEMKTPFENVIKIIKEKLFIRWQKGLDEIIHIVGGSEND